MGRDGERRDGEEWRKGRMRRDGGGMEWCRVEGGMGSGAHSPVLIVARILVVTHVLVITRVLVVTCVLVTREPRWLFWLVVVRTHRGSWGMVNGTRQSSWLSPVSFHRCCTSFGGSCGWLWLLLAGRVVCGWDGRFHGQSFRGQSALSRSNNVAHPLTCHITGHVLAWLVTWLATCCCCGGWWL